ncbi:MAG: 3-deoxy-D-manno-octulosonic acid transferase, partial [Muribaculaceae bacterium]|nr:3-deoxy-D-manno-octulosonic acid transferase [Muribaculaceae bacterium]
MLLYDAGIWLYRQGIRIASKTRNVKARQLNAGLNGVWDKLRSEADAGGGYVWIHAASLGEFEQGRPLMEKIRREHPDKKILLTFFSPSGYDVRKNYGGADVIVYMPQDTRRNVRKFLDIVRPEMAIFVKYEFWLNYLAELKRRDIPTYLISGIFRKDQAFFRSYGGYYRKALRCFTKLYLQDEGSRRLLEGIGIRNCAVTGDTRFDRVSDIMRGVRPLPLLDRFCATAEERRADRECSHRALIFMAGSSWPADEAVYGEWLRESEGVKGVIAPHEFDEERLRKMIEFFGNKAVLLSDATK